MTTLSEDYFYVCVKVLGAIIQSEIEPSLAFRQPKVGESLMFSGPDYGRLGRGICMALLILVPLVGCSGVAGVGGQGDTAAAPPGLETWRFADPG